MNIETGYKILTQVQFAEVLARRFEGAPVDIKDGYIHLSTSAQLDETLEKHFAGQSGLVIAAIPLGALGADLRWEPSRGGQLFPHFYGRLTPELISAHAPLTRKADGRAILPG